MLGRFFFSQTPPQRLSAEQYRTKSRARSDHAEFVKWSDKCMQRLESGQIRGEEALALLQIHKTECLAWEQLGKALL